MQIAGGLHTGEDAISGLFHSTGSMAGQGVNPGGYAAHEPRRQSPVRLERFSEIGPTVT
jgi:hypothetical protein